MIPFIKKQPENLKRARNKSFETADYPFVGCFLHWLLRFVFFLSFPFFDICYDVQRFTYNGNVNRKQIFSVIYGICCILLILQTFKLLFIQFIYGDISLRRIIFYEFYAHWLYLLIQFDKCFLSICTMTFARSCRRFKNESSLLGLEAPHENPFFSLLELESSCEISIQADENENISFVCW